MSVHHRNTNTLAVNTYTFILMPQKTTSMKIHFNIKDDFP